MVMGMQVLEKYKHYEHLYMEERKVAIAKFQATCPHFSDYEQEMKHYEKLETEIQALPSSERVNAAITLSIDPLKLALSVEAKAWKTAYGHSLNDRYRTSMENIVQFISNYSKCLSRPIKVREMAKNIVPSLLPPSFRMSPSLH